MKRVVIAEVDGREVGRYTFAYHAHSKDGVAPTETQLIEKARRSMKISGIPGMEIAKAKFRTLEDGGS